MAKRSAYVMADRKRKLKLEQLFANDEDIDESNTQIGNLV
jgi:hypothetical protein